MRPASDVFVLYAARAARGFGDGFAAIIAIFRFKIGMMWTLAACSAVGIGLYLLGLKT